MLESVRAAVVVVPLQSGFLLATASISSSTVADPNITNNDGHHPDLGQPVAAPWRGGSPLEPSRPLQRTHYKVANRVEP